MKITESRKKREDNSRSKKETGRDMEIKRNTNEQAVKKVVLQSYKAIQRPARKQFYAIDTKKITGLLRRDMNQ